MAWLALPSVFDGIKGMGDSHVVRRFPWAEEFLD